MGTNTNNDIHGSHGPHATQTRTRRIYSARNTEHMSRCRSATPSCDKTSSTPIYTGVQRPKSRSSLFGYDTVPIVERVHGVDPTSAQKTKKCDVTTNDVMSRLRDWSIRPVSAPNNVRRSNATRRDVYSARRETSSARRLNAGQNKKHVPEMQNVLKAAREARTFKEETKQIRAAQKASGDPEQEEKKDAAPVFNKRLFASQGTVIMTREARRLMDNNSRDNEICDTESNLNKADIQCLRCVTEGLKLIHKSEDFVKDVLSRVISYELYKAYEYVQPKEWEDNLSCYYILNGAVEVTYDLRSTESRHVYQANIIYSHGTGEYLGLVSPEGPTEDLAPPATIYTKELTQFIRVDRTRFHAIMAKATQMINDRKRDFFNSRSFLTNVTEEVKEKILHKFSIQDYPANRVLLAQGELTEYLFIVMSGRCQTYREVHIPEAEKDVLFYLTSRDPDDFFGEECILDRKASVCTVVTATATTCLKLHKSALQMVQRDRLARHIELSRHEFPADSELRDRGYQDSVWNRFKHGQVRNSLREGGKLQYLASPTCAVIHDRPPQDDELYTENMRRFVLKGSQFEPLRTQSAKTRKTSHILPVRPKTAVHRSHGQTSPKSPTSPPTEVPTDSTIPDQPHNIGTVLEEGQHTPAPPLPAAPSSTLLTADKAKELEKKIAKRPKKTATLCRVLFKALESKENLLKVLEEDGETGIHAKHAWKAAAQQDQQNFMKNGVLVTMTSEDIVRKAKALADTYADKWKSKFAEKDEEEWDTILHAENKQAKMLISANKLRIKDLKKKMAALQKQRERARQKQAHSKKIPGSFMSDVTEGVDRIENVQLTSYSKSDTSSDVPAVGEDGNAPRRPEENVELNSEIIEVRPDVYSTTSTNVGIQEPLVNMVAVT